MKARINAFKRRSELVQALLILLAAVFLVLAAMTDIYAAIAVVLIIAAILIHGWRNW